ncbi:hypothetical protein Pint_06085 [Pistacia integerrima]|uniref:Uncharacterized protein n=1 Tax=Pistacia integerrima TaxID=434235 RepID=A0ACC0Z9G4_9ROSI|nr:hypothetical protein Pint_06085 [Pistacia integerrima]
MHKVSHLGAGDPLYVAGGQPKSFDSEFANETFAQDGYINTLLTWMISSSQTFLSYCYSGYPRPLTPVPGDCGYYLHAHQLTLSHPTTNEVIEVMAPLPSILQTQEEAKKITIH